jgi:hypothetical protein
MTRRRGLIPSGREKTGAVPEEWNGPQVGLSLHAEKDIGGRLYPVHLSHHREVAIGNGIGNLYCNLV